MKVDYRATFHIRGVTPDHHPTMFSDDVTLLRLASAAMLYMELGAKDPGPRIVAIEIHDVSGRTPVLLSRTVPAGRPHADA